MGCHVLGLNKTILVKTTMIKNEGEPKRFAAEIAYKIRKRMANVGKNVLAVMKKASKTCIAMLVNN